MIHFNQRGYSFSELLAALALGVTAVMSYTFNTASSIRQQAASSNATIALQLARDKLEELQARGNPADENRCPSAGDIGLSAGGSAGGMFDRCWRIQATPLGTQLKQADVTVTWRDAQSTGVTLSALIYVGP